MTSILLHHPPLSAAAGALPAIDSPVRLWLDPALSRQGTKGGTWWPYSRNAGAELPGLIAAVDQRLGRITRRVGLHADAWDDIPHLVPARGRQVRVDCLRGADPDLIALTFAGDQPVLLLVIPSRAGSDPAASTPQVDELAEWENEGGHLPRQDPEGSPRRQATGQADRQPPASSPRSEPPKTVIDSFPLGRAVPSEPTTIRLSGELDIFTSPTLRSRLLDVLKSSTSLLILDLSAVSFCDASGLAVMVGIQRRARSMGISLALAAPRPSMTRLLHITGLDRSLPIQKGSLACGFHGEFESA
ncbi:STAS domain-containing protein [Nonomuraea sp. NPDC049400]|uniref:STAS domain-containing protein n=1 Tax=Nonomuraea sp. NPDC049400 TaxID=3364352 RepID=UPI0037A0EC89